MASVRTLVTIKRGGEYHPPLTEFHGLTDDEAAELAEVAVRIDAVEAPEMPVTPVEAPGLRSPPEIAEGLQGPAERQEDDKGETSRVDDISAAIDLLEEHDFTATGRPKIPALSPILGFKPTGEEITAALALRAEMAGL